MCGGYPGASSGNVSTGPAAAIPAHRYVFVPSG